VLGDRRQIDHVNTMLLDLGIMFHQLTSQETQSDRGKEILSAFLHGDLQALTAMKVLDEGIDVPQTETAFILASSSVRREWVQRRGRVLRRAPGKVGAVLHDFVVSPAGLSPPSSSSLLKSEVARVEAFGADAKNQYDEDGSAAAITKLEEYINRRD
jgi:superfamily II DNA or RNA helicase